jgi:predicted aconitase with swiveling domain
MADRSGSQLRWSVAARPLHAGEASGAALVLDEPLSMWGGLDPESGTIIDRRHPQVGQRVTGRVLVMTGGRGSSSSSTVLAEAIRAGTAPAAILLSEADQIVVLGALVAEIVDGLRMPVVQLDPSSHARIVTGDVVHVATHGRVDVRRSAA